MKKRIAILMALVLTGTLFFASCTSPASPGTDSSKSSETSSTESPKLSGELVVITLAGEPFVPAWQDQAAIFEKDTGVKVTVDSVPWENLREVCTLELASGTGAYDVLYVHPSWFQEFAKNGYLVPTDEYATKDEVDAYIPNLVEDYRYDGTLYGLPDWVTTHVLAYRTDIFEEKSLTPPKDWAELLAVCEKLSGGDYAPISFPGKKGGALASIFSSLIVSNGGWYYDDAGKPSVNSKEGVEVAEFLGDVAKYLPSGYQNFHWDENGKTAAGGKAAMTIIATQSSVWLEDKESSATAGKWDYVALKSNKGTVGGIIDDYCWSVAADSKNKEAAGEFVKFFTDTDAQKYFTSKSSTCGATKAYYEDKELQKSTPVLSAMSEILNENTKPAPSWGTWAAQQEMLEVNLQDVMNGKMSAQDALDQVQDKMSEK